MTDQSEDRSTYASYLTQTRKTAGQSFRDDSVHGDVRIGHYGISEDGKVLVDLYREQEMTGDHYTSKNLGLESCSLLLRIHSTQTSIPSMMQCLSLNTRCRPMCRSRNTCR